MKHWIAVAFVSVCLLHRSPLKAAEGSLTIGGTGVKPAALQIRDLEKMQPVKETWTAGDGKRVVLGVPIDKLLERQGLTPGRMGDGGTPSSRGWRRVVVASAPDGFQAVFTVAELTPHLGPTRALLAWKIDDKPLPPDRGPLRLVVLTDKVASRSVHSVNRLEVMELGGPAPASGGHHGAGHGANKTTATATATATATSDDLARVGQIHGAAGPFAVAGYRMGKRAMRELGITSGSLDLEVRHESPAQVQWSCIADGAQAATGASAGKLNLAVREAAADRTRTVFRRKSTGKSVAFQLTPAFVKRYLDLPRVELDRAGAEIMKMPDDQIFSPATP
jgi:formylmethanofuran dehydrogenase subunit E